MLAVSWSVLAVSDSNSLTALGGRTEYHHILPTVLEGKTRYLLPRTGVRRLFPLISSQQHRLYEDEDDDKKRL